MHANSIRRLSQLGLVFCVFLSTFFVGCDFDIFPKKETSGDPVEASVPDKTSEAVVAPAKASVLGKTSETVSVAPAKAPAKAPVRALSAGMTPDEVCALIGDASGTIQMESQTTLLYNRIMLDYVDGVLVQPSPEMMRKAEIRIAERLAASQAD